MLKCLFILENRFALLRKVLELYDKNFWVRFYYIYRNTTWPFFFSFCKYEFIFKSVNKNGPNENAFYERNVARGESTAIFLNCNVI